MSHHSPYANSNNIHEFSIKRGIKSILRSLKGKNNTLSSRVSVGDSTAGGSSNASGGSGTSIHTHSKPSAALASVGSYDTSERVRYNGRIRQSSDIVMTPREVIDSHRVTGRAESSPQGRHNQGPRSSLKDILGSQNSPDYPHGGVSVVYPKVRQIHVKPSPDASAKDLVCDKCDGKHETERCPYFKKDREKHPDAQRGNKKLGGMSKLPGALIRNARVVRQPGDGSCLFHSLSFGLRNGSTASSLRRQICNFIVDNPKLKIADTPLSDWVKWDSRSSVTQYARRMSGGAWGGGIEMAAVSKMFGTNVHVYEQCGSTFKRISAFDAEESPETKPVVRVLYGGGVHYDALII